MRRLLRVSVHHQAQQDQQVREASMSKERRLLRPQLIHAERRARTQAASNQTCGETAALCDARAQAYGMETKIKTTTKVRKIEQKTDETEAAAQVTDALHASIVWIKATDGSAIEGSAVRTRLAAYVGIDAVLLIHDHNVLVCFTTPDGWTVMRLRIAEAKRCTLMSHWWQCRQRLLP
jgi:hypothetical protein